MAFIRNVFLFTLAFVAPIAVHGLDLPMSIITVAGNGLFEDLGDGRLATSIKFNNPSGVAVDSSGNLFISDTGDNRIRKVGTEGTISTVAGNGAFGYFGDGGAATLAELNGPRGIAVDRFGNLYIADHNNNCIRKVDGKTGIISTVAGNGKEGCLGDNGPARSAELNHPEGIAIDKFGNLFVADRSNSRIRKVDKWGIISTVGGNGAFGYSGDGAAATLAELDEPSSIALDPTGNLYITDFLNHRIRKIVLATGIITTVTGNRIAGEPGDVTSTELSFPYGITIDKSGNLYTSEFNSARIRKVEPNTGKNEIMVGTGVAGYSGDGGLATLAQISEPSGLALDSSGNLYIADSQNACVRKIGIDLKSEAEYAYIRGYPQMDEGVRKLLVSGDEEKDILKKAQFYRKACADGCNDEIQQRIEKVITEAIQALRIKIKVSQNDKDKLAQYRVMLPLMSPSDEEARYENSQYAMLLLTATERDTPHESILNIVGDPLFKGAFSEIKGINENGETTYSYPLCEGCLFGNDGILIAGTIGGDLKSIRVGTVNTELIKLLSIKGTSRKAALFRSVGGNGAGFSQCYLVEIVDGNFRIVFTSPGSSSGGTVIREVGPEKKIEIVSHEQLSYKRLYWPTIFRWSGSSMDDVTDEYQDQIVKSYLEITDASERKVVDDLMIGRGGRQKALWEKAIAPLK